MEIRSLAHTDFGTIAKAFADAFALYDVQLSSEELRRMLRRRGFDPSLSFAAFDNSDIAGFTLNGTGSFGRVPTAYDTGTGTLPRWRGRGLASQIFEASLPYLRAKGIEQYLLEVLQHNTAAIAVYRRLGFETSREFNYFTEAADSVIASLETRHIDTGDKATEAFTIRPVKLAEIKTVAHCLWDFEPSWQNNFAAVERALEDFVLLGAYPSSRDSASAMPVGYAIFEPASGDITQLAVAKPLRRRGAGTALLSEMLKRNISPGIKCVNTAPECDSITEFLQANGISLAGKQFEMIKRL